MEQTPNYALSQWDEQDRILREDFNANNAKVEQALAEQAEQLAPIAAQIGKLGNCQVYASSYTGDGNTAGKSITFPSRPIIVMISDQMGRYRSIFWQGMTYAPFMYEYGFPMTITWNGNTVSWYYEGNAESNFNVSGTSYYVAALLDMDV